MQKFQNAFALIIGVGNDLPITVNDANVINNILTDGKRGAYSPENTRLLVEKDASKNGIIESLDWLAEKVNNHNNPMVFIYYSGHGGVTPNKEYFLLPHDFDLLNSDTTCVQGKLFSEKIKSIKTNKLMVFLDCCHAAGFTFKSGNKTEWKSSNKELISILESGVGRLVMTSSRSSELSWIMPGAKYSAFTGALVEAMDGKAETTDTEYVGVLNTITYLTERVPVITNNKQTPVLANAIGLENFSICAYDKNLSKSSPFIKSIDYLGTNHEPTSIMESQESVKKQVRDFIRRNKIKECFAYLFSLYPENDELTQLQVKYKKNEQDNRMGILSHDEYNRGFSITTSSLLKFEIPD